jgi:predicted ABC-type sugar transport system permease subunit
VPIEVLSATVRVEGSRKVFLGGTSPAGGRGGIGGTVLAALIDAALANGPIRLDVPLSWSPVAGGVPLLAAVTIERVRLRVTHAGA